MPIDVVYVDNHVLVVNKPAGLLTQPSGTTQDNLEDQAKAWIKEHYQKPGNVFLHAIHRLDKPVSGLVLFARTSKALSRLQESMRNKNTRKFYQALVTKKPSPLEGDLENTLTHGDHKSEVDAEEGKLSTLHYRFIKDHPPYYLVEIELDTGRYHQIRAQFAHAGMPIVGDVKYGSSEYFNKDTIALHHWRMEFPHPVTGELLSFQKPLFSEK
jgi:23S rRNA pseudouridine1911/1915/1917 synthase